jgi:hypothetical protein
LATGDGKQSLDLLEIETPSADTSFMVGFRALALCLFFFGDVSLAEVPSAHFLSNTTLKSTTGVMESPVPIWNGIDKMLSIPDLRIASQPKPF